MKLGFSKSWPEAMNMITGQPKMSAQPLMQYFQPLIKWLEAENNKNNDVRGWPEYDWKPSSMSNTFVHPHTYFIYYTIQKHKRKHMHLGKPISWKSVLNKFSICQAKCFLNSFPEKRRHASHRGINFVFLLLRLTVKLISFSFCFTDDILLKRGVQI